MVNIIGKKNSLRDLSDEYFESILKDLAEQVSFVDINPHYTDDILRKDWDNLLKWNTVDNSINSTSRIGMKLCEKFFPNFYDIEDNKGRSFRKLWTKENLVKILKWNRKSHSTPYLSELKRGIYFCCGMTKNTMYRPQMAKMVCDYYKPKIVLDPCAGWGGRMLGVVASGAEYIAFEPNKTTYLNLLKLVEFLGIGSKVTIICDDAMNMLSYDLHTVDLVLTSPPYFDLEVYDKGVNQSITKHDTYRVWSDIFLRGIIHKSNSLLSIDGASCWNVGKVGKNDMWQDVIKYHNELNKKEVVNFTIVSSKRQSNQDSTKKQKSIDSTVSFR
jgi:hypothetical protein